MKLSVLDQSVISEGQTAINALQNTIELAKITEELGYTRFWVAEHHNSNGMVGTSPEILMSQIASNTKKIRIGSGGVLLPQYSPYKVAENFKMLETLFPNRIDVGIGRSPGGSTITRLALTDGIRKSMNEFPRQVSDLQDYLFDTNSSSQPIHNVKAYPSIQTFPEMWLLGVTHRGARLAGEMGTSFTFGHFIHPTNGLYAMETYRRNFQPSKTQSSPKANVCIFVVCSDTQEKAEEIAVSQDLWLLAVERGLDTRIPSPKQKKLSPRDKEKIMENRKRMIVGTPQKVREEIQRLSDYYQTDEFMIINNTFNFEDKVRTYHLLAEVLLK
ncbi:LLM class flavin-dependent oxidoreductase [Metabacillus litoralis]|uniref:LLM class flavin-dependent oxidoreductase n=1 Tax=Metabacillus litoralis TaxID=152268 RepID=UPI000EF56B23|nr:LLM class flavin-dependent oxidoreductase [Metabacillus litoralis]